MTKTILAAALFATVGWMATAQAADHANSNGSDKNPQSSTAATPSDKEHSPGTVGAMKDAGDGSFTASKKAEEGVHLEKK